MNVEGDALSLEELRTLRHDNPTGLFRHLADVQKAFLFGVEDHREEEERWGGEVRVIVNRNVELHFVPALSDAMRTMDELPQFSVFPSEERADTVEQTSQLIDDGEEVKGAIFYVDPTEYDVLVGAATEVIDRYEDFDLIPDTYFLESPLLQFVERTVLEHELVRAEREFDFRRGLVGGAPPPAEEELEDEPLPVIGQDDDDEDYTAHPDLVLGEDESDDLGLPAGVDGDDEEEDGEDGEDDEGGGPKKHFRTVWT